jgi:hypothetical protein
VSLAAVAALACTGSEPDRDAGSAADVASPPDGTCSSGLRATELATTAPDGVGFCCIPALVPDCDCPLVGGWVGDPCDCAWGSGPGVGSGLCDVDRRDWIPTTYEHGCTGWRFDGSPTCGCGCDAGPPPALDAAMP